VALYEVVIVYGTLVAETILASVRVRAHQQAEHMDASDLIKALQNTLRGGARPHMENGVDDTSGKIMPLRSIARGGPAGGLEQCTAARRPTASGCWRGMRLHSFGLARDAQGLRLTREGGIEKLPSAMVPPLPLVRGDEVIK
jgi:hypothetical protein